MQNEAISGPQPQENEAASTAPETNPFEAELEAEIEAQLKAIALSDPRLPTGHTALPTEIESLHGEQE